MRVMLAVGFILSADLLKPDSIRLLQKGLEIQLEFHSSALLKNLLVCAISHDCMQDLCTQANGYCTELSVFFYGILAFYNLQLYNHYTYEIGHTKTSVQQITHLFKSEIYLGRAQVRIVLLTCLLATILHEIMQLKSSIYEKVKFSGTN